MQPVTVVMVMLALFFFGKTVLCAQTHVSVPVDHAVYYILEQAAVRGLCSPLSGVRPYTQSVVVSVIEEILDSENADKLKDTEREILEQFLVRFSKPKTGLDLQRGAYYAETAIDENDTLVSADIGIGADFQGSVGFYPNNSYWGAEPFMQAYVNGDLGKNVSYGFNTEGGLIKAPRKSLGKYNTYYPKFNENYETDEYVDREIDVYSEPLTHFPYSYKKRWDGSIFFLDSISRHSPWPDSTAFSFNLLSEITASFLDNKLLMRLGRISHEWGASPVGSSLAFNMMARPFFAFEAEFNPVSWFGISTLTGTLEYYNSEGVKTSSKTFQNAFSATIMQFRYKNYIFFDYIDAVVFPKRFEPGYMSPVNINLFYQNNIGDFDNMAMSFVLKAQYPGLGNIWASLFIDEVYFLGDWFTLDRQMFATQVGMTFYLPLMAFSSIKLSYTVVNPYCYTHNRNFNPWYGTNRMETAYVNNGVGLGYYLPPNSDELLFQFSTMPAKNLTTNLQYQMIQHGADFGSSAVDGSNLSSELNPINRSNEEVLKRYFLKDGAYQWYHIIKLGGEWTLSKAPLAFYFEAGTVISYFTNIKELANDGRPHPYSIVDTVVYPKSTGFIAKLGFRLFPK